MRLCQLVNASLRVAATSRRLEKIQELASCLRRLSTDEIDIGVHYLTGGLPQGHVGIGPALLRELSATPAAARASLALTDVNAVFEQVVVTVGRGSVSRRRDLLATLFARATGKEQTFLVRLALGELRQGALEGIMIEAIAQAAAVPVAEIRRAFMLRGDLAVVARTAFTRGRAGLEHFSIQLLRPVKPMLAQTADSVDEALAQLGSADFEFKLDGVRVQLHKAGDDVRVFTRRLHDVTAAVPEIVEAARRLPVRELILDGEAIALRADGTPQPFQTTMRRFGRKLDVATMRDSVPLTPVFFDCLYLEGESLIDRPVEERIATLAETVPASLRIPRVMTADADEARLFMEQALQKGHEGVMVKALTATYEAGNRGSSWLKVKRPLTLDLVVLAAEWGHGRRDGYLSNLHLGARDPAAGNFVMLGKTFKGMTDKVLAWQTRKLKEIEVAEDRYTVYVRPQLVVEVAFDDIQASPQYPSGLALRFARLKRYRPDKPVQDADTIDTVRAIYAERAKHRGNNP